MVGEGNGQHLGGVQGISMEARIGIGLIHSSLKQWNAFQVHTNPKETIRRFNEHVFTVG
jgi:hypothetical protein